MSDPWETIRYMTMDQLVTYAKLNGSAFVLNGFTTPERWPFTIVLAVGSPGNEAVPELAKKFHEEMTARGAPLKKAATNPRTESE